ncbi:unnamed protein product, partial [Rotaria sp. Silwood1]
PCFIGASCISDPRCGGPGSGVPSGQCVCRGSFFVPPYIHCVRHVLRDYTRNLTNYYYPVVYADNSAGDGDGTCY